MVTEVWIYDLEQRTEEVVYDAEYIDDPVFFPDSKAIVFFRGS